MKLKNFSSSAVAALTIAFGGVGLNVLSATTPLTQSAQAAYASNCSFTAKTYQPTKIRPNPNTYTKEVAILPANQTVQFSTFVNGEPIWDAAARKSDPLWFKLSDGRGYVASAVVQGYPPNSPCPTTNTKIEQFLKSVNGQYSISHPTTRSLNGQCATLTLRYVRDAFLPSNAPMRVYGNGKDVAGNVAAAHPTLFQPVTNQGLPKRGAIISFSGIDFRYGHVGIVMESRYSGSQRQIKLMDSNGDGKAPNTTVKIGNWIDINSFKGTRGWTNPR